ncbi:tRNA pseudouridine(55) synthase TruB [Nibricoccus aquaticus]|uniref:tRNA pseudouridine synthase B n=1 Tax=Nibricoccus aquaticus TaxID=2576891 RepID=A0A290Q5T7_9BACT|nr:tRNA pseudouridine(55) synthase TruB [Nibricoccus aquaticus]ATC62530.1 tRNA pseudouridine(55) synthase TruB [Nibricoccus aquaticus]
MLVQPKELEGVLLVDKPTDHTSHDVIARLRGILKMRRIGHAGTLDPMATGVLVVLLGKATKASQYLMSLDKEYIGTIKLGSVTNTQDAEGEVLETRPVPPLTEAEAKAFMATFVGDQYQLPPMFSAIKIDGVPLYKQARKGEEVEREPRFVRVSSFDMTRFASPEIDFVLRCTKGTYVRTVAHDLGQKIGCGAHLSSLRRTATGKFTISQCLTLEQIQAFSTPELERRLVPVRDAVPTFAL